MQMSAFKFTRGHKQQRVADALYGRGVEVAPDAANKLGAVQFGIVTTRTLKSTTGETVQANVYLVNGAYWIEVQYEGDLEVHLEEITDFDESLLLKAAENASRAAQG